MTSGATVRGQLPDGLRTAREQTQAGRQVRTGVSRFGSAQPRAAHTEPDNPDPDREHL